MTTTTSDDRTTEALCAQVGGDMRHMDLEGVGTQRATLDHTRQEGPTA